MIQDILAWLAANPEWLGIGVAVVACVESFFVIGIVVPGVAILFGAAATAGSLELPVWPLLAWAACGAIVGDTVSFFIGRFLGYEARETGLMARHKEKWDKGHRFFVKYGIFAIVAGRFIGFIRPVMPTIAGAAGMRKKTFFVTDMLSAAAWAPAYILPGYYGGSWIFGM